MAITFELKADPEPSIEMVLGDGTINLGPEDPGGGTSDHGELDGLEDDDHPQYHTDSRGDERYALVDHTHTISASDVGLGNLDNTSDADKPVSTAAQTALDAKADLVSGKVPTAQIPAIALTEYLGEAADESEMLLLSGQSGDWCIRTDAGMTYVITGSDPTDVADWTALPHPSAPVTSVNGETGLVILNKSSVGLDNVDDTSDADKPVSDATQTALDAKAAAGDLGTAAALDAGTVVQSSDSSITQALALTQGEYDALDPVSATTLYVITD